MKKLPQTAERNARIIVDYERLPRQSMAAIGRKHNVTRAYVRRVVNDHYATKNTQ